MANAKITALAAAAENYIHVIPKNRRSEWTFMPFCLWQYRCGDYDAAAQACQRDLVQSRKFPACDAMVHATLAMCDYQQGRSDDACAELTQARQLVEDKFKGGLDRGQAGLGFWFDWVYARHLVQEASVMIDCDSDQSGPSDAKP